MTARKIKTVNVDKMDFVVYLKKAKDFYDTMIEACKTERWTSAGLNVVHCAISCCDAILTFHVGVRSVDEDHMQAVELFERLPAGIEDGEAMTFKRIVAKKNLIAYECRDFRQPEALEILKLTERFYRWALTSLPKI